MPKLKSKAYFKWCVRIGLHAKCSNVAFSISHREYGQAKSSFFSFQHRHPSRKHCQACFISRTQECAMYQSRLHLKSRKLLPTYDICKPLKRNLLTAMYIFECLMGQCQTQTELHVSHLGQLGDPLVQAGASENAHCAGPFTTLLHSQSWHLQGGLAMTRWIGCIESKSQLAIVCYSWLNGKGWSTCTFSIALSGSKPPICFTLSASPGSSLEAPGVQHVCQGWLQLGFVSRVEHLHLNNSSPWANTMQPYTSTTPCKAQRHWVPVCRNYVGHTNACRIATQYKLAILNPQVWRMKLKSIYRTKQIYGSNELFKTLLWHKVRGLGKDDDASCQQLCTCQKCKTIYLSVSLPFLIDSWHFLLNRNKKVDTRHMWGYASTLLY